jgi:negative regulator of flagellin synthesis FlgM
MVIDKIGNINNIVETKRSKSVQKNTETKKSSDSVQISSEGLKAAEEARFLQMVQEAPDVRADRVNQIKEQIANGTYDKHLDDKVLDMVADTLLNNLFRK